MNLNFFIFILIVFLKVCYIYATSTCTPDPLNFISIRGSKDRTSWIPAPKFEKCISFYVKSDPYFYIHLSMFNLTTGQFTNFISPYVGYDNNKYSGIYDQTLKMNILKNIPTLNYISLSQTHGFWISWYENVFKMGQEGKTNPFLQYEMIGTPNIQFIGFQGTNTDNLSIKIKNCYTCPGVSVSKDLDAILSTVLHQNFNITNILNAQKDLLQQFEFSSTKYDEIKLTEQATKPFLELQLKEIEDIFAKAKIYHDQLINSSLINNKDASELFKNIKSIFYNLVGAITFKLENSFPELDIRLENSTGPIIRN